MEELSKEGSEIWLAGQLGDRLDPIARETSGAGGQVQHIASTEQSFRSVRIENGS